MKETSCIPDDNLSATCRLPTHTHSPAHDQRNNIIIVLVGLILWFIFCKVIPHNNILI